MHHTIVTSLGISFSVHLLILCSYSTPFLIFAGNSDSRSVWQEGTENTDPQIVAYISQLKEKNDTQRIEASNSLVKIGKPAVPALIKALKDKDIRPIVTFILGRIGPAAKEAIPALSEELKDEDKNTRAKAAEALGKMGVEAIPALRTALLDKEAIVRTRAVQAFGRIGPDAKAATSALVDLLRDPDETVRSETEQTLKKINQE